MNLKRLGFFQNCKMTCIIYEQACELRGQSLPLPFTLLENKIFFTKVFCPGKMLRNKKSLNVKVCKAMLPLSRILTYCSIKIYVYFLINVMILLFALQFSYIKYQYSQCAQCSRQLYLHLRPILQHYSASVYLPSHGIFLLMQVRQQKQTYYIYVCMQ